MRPRAREPEMPGKGVEDPMPGLPGCGACLGEVSNWKSLARQSAGRQAPTRRFARYGKCDFC